MSLSAVTRATLLTAARYSIRQGLDKGQACFRHTNPDPALRAACATFVTLKRHAVLRGCIGNLDANQPLLDDVMHNARLAAFQDPRFPPLVAAELQDLHVEISVLSRSEALAAPSRAELLRSLRPGEDGVIVQEGARRATFLPAVWTHLPDKAQFYAELMRKAGLDPEHWSANLQFFRYHTETFGDRERT